MTNLHARELRDRIDFLNLLLQGGFFYDLAGDEDPEKLRSTCTKIIRLRDEALAELWEIEKVCVHAYISVYGFSSQEKKLSLTLRECTYCGTKEILVNKSPQDNPQLVT